MWGWPASCDEDAFWYDLLLIVYITGDDLPGVLRMCFGVICYQLFTYPGMACQVSREYVLI